MSKLTDFFKFNTKPIQDIKSGFYTSHDLLHNEKPYRLHLRIEPNQNGVLTLNASTVLHTNKTATEMAYFLIKGQNTAEIANTIANRYDAPKAEIKRDVEGFYETLMSFTEHEDLPPTGILGMLSDIEETDIIAPYRLDCYFAGDEGSTMMSTAEWKVVFEKAYNAGIPHVMLLNVNEIAPEVFFDLLKHLEVLGLVSGLVATPTLFEDPQFLNQILLLGLDHLVLDADPRDDKSRELLINILGQDLFTCLRMPVVPEFDYSEIIGLLFEHGINAFAFTGDNASFSDERLKLESLITDKQIPIVDDMPYAYKAENMPMSLAFDDQGSMKYLSLLPNGKLIIPGIEKISIGSLLTEPWETLWTERKRHRLD